MVRRTGMEVAVDQTLEIAKHLDYKHGKEFHDKLIYSIFDDQLKAHTALNRQQRHAARDHLREELKKYETQ
jgi:hypothetical protein